MAICEKILDFGKHKGKALGGCETSYIKWLAQHPKRLREDHRHFAIAAKALLEQKKKKVQSEEDRKKDYNFFAMCQITIRQNARVFERKTNLTQAQVDEREAGYLDEELSEEQKAQYARGKALKVAGYQVA